MNYIKIGIINTENLPQLHFTIIYALKVIDIYCVCMEEILYNHMHFDYHYNSMFNDATLVA